MMTQNSKQPLFNKRPPTIFACLLLASMSISPAHANSHLNTTNGPTTPPPIVVAPPPVTPPPLPTVPDVSIFVAQDGQPTGPFNLAELSALVAQGKLLATTKVWQEGMADWAAASTVAEVKAILDTAPAQLEDLSEVLVGIWVSEPTPIQIPGIGQGMSQNRSIFNADGSTSSFSTIDVQSGGVSIRLTITGQGTYKLMAVGNNTYLLTPDMEMATMVPGQVTRKSTFTTPFKITLTGENSLQDDDGVNWVRQ